MRRIVALALYMLPLLYVSSILAVCVHEVIGHGLVAQLLGGEFNGFTIKLDGMGWADIDAAGLALPELTAMYLGGAVCTALLCLLFLSLGISKRFSPVTRFTFALLSFGFLLDGFPYYLWDAILLGGIGDYSMIWNYYPSEILRKTVIALSGIGLSAGIIACNTIWFHMGARMIGQKKGLSVMLLALQVMCWFAFDWNQIVPGAGLLPSITGIALATGTLAVMHNKRERVC